MADSVVSLLLETLNQLLDQDSDLLYEVGDAIRSFHAELKSASGFIRNSEGQGNAEAVKALAKKISGVAYKAEDVIDTLAVNVAKQRTRGGFGKFIHVFGHRNMLQDAAKRINNFTRQVKEIYGERVSEGNQIGDASSDSFLAGERSTKKAVYRPIFPKMVQTLLDELVKGGRQREFISIIGEAGVGKTALVREIYSDVSVQGQFKYRAWLHASRHCKARELLQEILEHFRPTSTGERQGMTEEQLQKKLSECLEKNQYLIVVDDLRKIERWDMVEQAFPDDSNGSRILLTCRPEYRDSNGSPTISHFLSPLDDAGSWDFLLYGLFPSGICAPKLEAPGKQMAEKCKGSPLSLSFLGRLLAMQLQHVEAWYKLANYLNTSCIQGSLHSIDLLLSFVHENLPNHLILCFLYFGMFPEGAEIPVKQLIQFWIAEGFIRKKGSKKEEDVGEQYLDELISLNLIIPISRRTDGGVKTCSIHDLFRKFCIFKGREMNYLEAPESLTDAHENTRRLSIQVSSLKGILSKLRHRSGVRSFHFSVQGARIVLPIFGWNALYKGFKLLRVLNLGTVDVFGVPKEVGRLIHLRYLRIRAPGVRHVPSTICNLLNLQTFDMRESSLSYLPDGIWKLQQLRHLYLFLLSSLPDHRGADEKSFVNLQTLFCIRPHKGMKRLMVKSKFPNVRKLKIASQKKEETTEFLESLDHLYHLQSLKIVSASKLPDPDAFPLKLTKLTFQGASLEESCMKTLEKLPNLRVLKLLQDSVSVEKIDISAGGFPQLLVLKMVELKITEWVLGINAMGNLGHLVINKCDQLKTMPSSLLSLATLQVLEVILPSADLRESLQQFENKDGLQMRITPQAMF
ncbi:disease resistance protein RPP8-like [Juglans microcarpa x Juglans regia]|uniref:disease resistance protein RPP8-like n=1 Tax=Juglans microcarpa x Juglans regia TaxID=2249226 RepID=UPI001B7DE580|nr:disease resistance protein RPP8-like [Juglans microcarpa x Juglans regia]